MFDPLQDNTAARVLLSDAEARALTQKLLSFVRADDASVSVTSDVYSHLRFAANAFATSGRREPLGRRDVCG